MKFKLGAGLPGHIWQSGRPIWIENIHDKQKSYRVKLFEELGIHGVIGFPIIFCGKVIAVLEFFSHFHDKARFMKGWRYKIFGKLVQ